MESWLAVTIQRAALDGELFRLECDGRGQVSSSAGIGHGLGQEGREGAVVPVRRPIRRGRALGMRV